MNAETLSNGEALKASDWTRVKQANFRSFMTAYTAIAAEVVRRQRASLTYIELTAGPGFVDIGGAEIRCSPLIALDVFRNHPNINVDCHFIEHDYARFASLNNAVMDEMKNWSSEQETRIRSKIECCDSKSVLCGPNRITRCNKYGLVYWDGLGGNPRLEGGHGQDTYPSTEAMEWLVRNSCHDLLFMASGTAPKRKQITRLNEILNTIPRKQVWLSETHGPWQWVFVLATDWPHLAQRLSSYAKIKLYQRESEKGARILDDLGLTKTEREKRYQPELWPESI